MGKGKQRPQPPESLQVLEPDPGLTSPAQPAVLAKVLRARRCAPEAAAAFTPHPVAPSPPPDAPLHSFLHLLSADPSPPSPQLQGLYKVQGPLCPEALGT